MELSTTKFIEIINILFLRFNINREKKIKKKQRSITKNLSDTLLLLNKYGIGKKKVLNSKDIKCIKILKVKKKYSNLYLIMILKVKKRNKKKNLLNNI